MRYIRQTAAILLLVAVSWADTPVSLIYKGKNGNMDFLQPVFPLRIGVVQESGPPVQNQDFLQCKAKMRLKKILVDGKEADLIETVLTCRDNVKFVIRGIEFEVKD